MAAFAGTPGLDNIADPKTARLALVIGNGGYSGTAKLPNPTNDAEAVTKELTKLGFAVTILKDCKRQEMLEAIDQFIGRLGSSPAATAAGLIYYAGHGVEIDGANYLLPTDITVQSQLGLTANSISIYDVIRQLEKTRKASLLFLDCCRDNPFSRKRGGGGLARIEPPPGIFIGYATQPGAVALDGDPGNSPFTSSFCAHLPDPDASVSQMMIRIRREVFDKTAGSQIPWDQSCLLIDFGFNPTTAKPLELLTPEEAKEKARAEAAKKEAEYWELTRESESEQLLRSFITQYPYSAHRPEAERKLRWLWWKERFFRVSAATAAATLSACILLSLFAAVQWQRFSDYSPGYLLTGGTAKPLVVRNRAHCRLRCILAWGCVGYSYHDAFSLHQCFLNQDTLYTKDDPTYTSSYLTGSKPHWPWGAIPPTPTPFSYQYDIFFDEPNVINEDGSPAPTKAPHFERIGAQNIYNSWGRSMDEIYDKNWREKGRSAGLLCQKLCADQAKCAGFLFNVISEHCKLFGSEPQRLTIPARGLERIIDVTVPGTVGGIKK
jgi:hypothetical protein